MASKRILIVDDEENIGRSLRMILEREGYAVNFCRSVAEFTRHPDAGRADAYLLDMKLPDGSGIDLLKAVKQNGATAPAIMISGHGTIADAVEATRAGAFDFLEKPLSRDRVLLAVKHAMEHSTLRQENERLRELVGTSPKMIGSSPAWQRGVEQASMGGRNQCNRTLALEKFAPERLCVLNPMRRPDDVPVNGKPTQECARERDKCELQLCNYANIPAPGVNSGDDGQRADDDGKHCNKIFQHEPLEPCRGGRH